MRSSNWLGTWQIFNTLVPYGLLWWLAVVLLARGSWLLLPVLCLMVLFLARCFSLMHDCGHYSLFRHRPTNRWVGFLLGIVAGLPQLPWSRGHAFHHRHNGNWGEIQRPIRFGECQFLRPMEQLSQADLSLVAPSLDADSRGIFLPRDQTTH